MKEYLNVHQIQNWLGFPFLRFKIDSGRANFFDNSHVQKFQFSRTNKKHKYTISSCINTFSKSQGRVVRKPVNVNPGLNVD